MIQRSVSQNVVAWTIAVVLLIASLFKAWSDLRHPQALEAGWSENVALQTSLEVGEAALAVLLVAGVWPRAVWGIATFVFTVFVVVTAIDVLRGKDSCGCFGAVPVRPIYTMLLDVAIVATLFLSGRPPASGVKSRGGRSWAIATVVGISWLIAVIIFFQTRPAIAVEIGGDFGKPGALVVLEPNEWPSQKFALAKHVDQGTQLLNGRWLVLLVHHDCDHCAAALPRYLSALSDSGGQWRLAVIEMPPYADAENPPPWQLPPGVLSGRLDSTRDWFATTPVAIYLNDGKVLAAHEGDSAAIPDSSW